MSGFNWRYTRTRGKQLIYRCLSWVFGFDKWHFSVVRENCNYFEQVHKLHNEIGATTTIEVGCGLGEIISGLQSETRIGIDRDPAVLRAARFLRSPKVHFLTDSEVNGAIAGHGIRPPVCLIFLNWFHVYEEATVRAIVRNYVEVTRASVVIFDVIRPNTSGYKFWHSSEVLGAIGPVVSVTNANDRIRDLVVVNVSPK